MAVTGGDITEVIISNPNLGTFIFTPLEGEDNTYDIGGFRNDDGDAVDGAGRLIVTKNRKPGSLQVVLSSDEAQTLDYTQAVALAADLNDNTVTFSVVNGVTYSGLGTIVGDLQLNVNKSTFSMKISSGAGFKKQ